MTWAMLLNAGRERLSKAGVPDAELDAWYLFEHAFGISRAAYFLQAAKEADAGSEALAAYEDMLKNGNPGFRSSIFWRVRNSWGFRFS